MENLKKSPVEFLNTNGTDILKSLIRPVESFASSFGLRPFKIIISENKHLSSSEGKNYEKSMDQTWLLLLAVRRKITTSNISDFINEIRKSKKYSESSLASYRKAFEDSINTKDSEGRTWVERQARTGLDILLASAQQLNFELHINDRIDANQLDDQPGIKQEGYTSIFSVQVTLNKENGITKSNYTKAKPTLA